MRQKGTNKFHHPLFPKSIYKMPVHKMVDSTEQRLKKFRVIDFNFLEMVEFLGADKNVGLNTTLWKA
jgi:hypothetical protein